MRVIPAVNEKTFEEVQKRVAQAAEILKISLPSEVLAQEGWIHVDVADGTFTPNVLWHNSQELGELKAISYKLKAKFEIHLMVKRPEWALGEWLAAGADRVVIHYEELELQGDTCLFGSQVVLGIGPEVSAEQFLPAAKYVKQILLLAVPPGKAGQLFDEKTIEKIKFLRAHLPDVTIEVDGGVNPETAVACKKAGANIVVSTSYIWQSRNPIEAFEKLRGI